MYGALSVSIITDAGACRRFFSRQSCNPSANTPRDVEIFLLSKDFVCRQKSLPYECGPHNDRLISWIPSAPARKGEMICPCIILKFSGLIHHQPIKVFLRFLPVPTITGRLVSFKVSPRHITPTLCGWERSNTEKGPKVNWALANGLKKYPVKEKATEGQYPQR